MDYSEAEFLTPQERKRKCNELRSRILNVLPAATYHMDRFLSLVSVAISDKTQSASIECGPQPVLLVNEDFVNEFCIRDEHLLMLVLHELYHVILGHSRLFQRTTVAHNIVFDAVINSLLCQQFQEPIYLEFFKNINSDLEFPSRLLRPPEKWPKYKEYPCLLNEKERQVMDLLYGPNSRMVTYVEIMELMADKLNQEEFEDFILLGDHDQKIGDSRQDKIAVDDVLLTGILKEVTADWPTESNPTAGRGISENILDWLMPQSRSPRTRFLNQLYRLLRKARIIPASPHTPYAWRRIPSMTSIQTAIINPRDRLAVGRRELFGENPLLYYSEYQSDRLRWSPRTITHIYIDISGSMDDYLPWLVGTMETLYRRRICNIFVFSTVVDQVKSFSNLHSGIANTFGTDINCVLEHLITFSKAKTPSKVVILTDGYTGKPNQEIIMLLRHRRVKFYAGLIGHGYGDDLKPFVDCIEQLPSLN